MARTDYLVGGTGVVMETRLAEAIQRTIDGLKDQTARGLVTAAEAVADDAEGKVPVKTGRLKRSIRAFVKAFPDEVRAGVGIGGETAPYAYFVKFGPKGPGPRNKSVWQETMRKPMLARADEVAAKLAKQIADSVGGT